MTTFIDLVPLDKLTKIERYILLLCSAPYRISGCINPPPERLLTALDIDSYFLIHWIYKKHWDKSHKLPWMKKESREALDKSGEFTFQLLRLCLALEGYKRSETAIIRWGRIFLEGRMLDLKKAYEPQSFKRDDQEKNQEKINKRNLKAHLQEKSKQLGSKDAPSNPFNSSKVPHFSRLIEEAIAEEGSNPTFKNDYWRPFTKAYSSWVNSVDRSGVALAWSEDVVWYQRNPLLPKTTKTTRTTKTTIKIPSLDPFYVSTPVILSWQELERLQHSFLDQRFLVSSLDGMVKFDI